MLTHPKYRPPPNTEHLLPPYNTSHAIPGNDVTLEFQRSHAPSTCQSTYLMATRELGDLEDSFARLQLRSLLLLPIFGQKLSKSGWCVRTCVSIKRIITFLHIKDIVRPFHPPPRPIIPASVLCTQKPLTPCSSTTQTMMTQHPFPCSNFNGYIYRGGGKLYIYIHSCTGLCRFSYVI